MRLKAVDLGFSGWLGFIDRYTGLLFDYFLRCDRITAFIS